MEKEKEEKSINWLLIILNIIIGAIILLAINIIYFVDQVYALTLTPTQLQCSWNTDANTIRTENCLTGNDYNIGGYTNYVNFIPTFQSSYGDQLWTIDFFLDMYVVDYGQEGNYILTPNFAFYKNNVQQNIRNLSKILETQRADCSNQDGCMLITTYHYSFQWQGDINGVSIQNLSAYYNRGDCGWLQGNPTTCLASYPRIHYLQMTASYSDNTQGTIENSTNTIINNNNQNTQEIINNQNSSADRIIDSNTTSAQSVINADNYNTERTIDAIEKQNLKCTTYNYENEPIGITGGYLNSNGQIITSGATNWRTSTYIEVEEGKTYILNKNVGGGNYCLYGEDKTLINCVEISTGNNNITPITNGFIRYSFVMVSGRTTTFIGEYCYNMLEGKPYNKRPVDTEKEQEYLESEQELLDLYNSDQLDIVDISIDTNGSNWVWERITQYLNTNELIRLMVISILSLGVVKLVLSR